jgi:outer membrane immunogenic protein
MKKFLASVVGLGALAAVPAIAADMPLKAPPPVIVNNWTGCYLGLSIGTNYGRSNGYSGTATTQAPVSNIALANIGAQQITDRFDLSGMLGGAFAGCNYQFVGTGFVIGVEGDWSITNKEGQAFNVPFVSTAALLIIPATDIFSLKERWLGTARVRLGYSITDNWLWYVTGGAAWAKLDSAQWQTGIFAAGNVPGGPGSTTYLQSDRRRGWTVGVGTEYAVGYGWTIRSEFLYVDLGRYTTFTNVPDGGIFTNRANPVTNLSVNLHDYIWRVGMSYKFGWTPAVVANY